MKKPAKSTYVFEWLDNHITFELHPAFSFPNPMPDETVQAMVAKVRKEMVQLANDFRQQFFSQKGEGNSEMLIIKNYDAITGMINKAYSHLHHENIVKSNIKPVLDTVLELLEELRGLFKTNYAKYLSTEQYLPATELEKFRAEIIEKRPNIVDKLHATGNGDEVSSIVLDALDLFADRIARQEQITEREVIYHRSIIKDIEDYRGQETALSNCPSLHELLIYWGLNSKACIRYFSLGMEAIMKNSESVDDQLEFMRLQLKNINTLPMIPDFIYDPSFPSLKEYFSDYISNEITYLEKKRIGFLPNESYNAEKNKSAAFKLVCALSADQIALVLRGAVDMKLIKAKSMSSVFSTMVPYLSTQQKENLSPEAVRTKSYEAEERDIEIAAEAMMQLADMIKGYALNK